MEKKFSLSINSVQEASKNISLSLENIEKSTSKAIEQIDSLLENDWDGEAKKAFETSYENWKTNKDLLIKDLAIICKYLKNDKDIGFKFFILSDAFDVNEELEALDKQALAFSSYVGGDVGAVLNTDKISHNWEVHTELKTELKKCIDLYDEQIRSLKKVKNFSFSFTDFSLDSDVNSCITLIETHQDQLNKILTSMNDYEKNVEWLETKCKEKFGQIKPPKAFDPKMITVDHIDTFMLESMLEERWAANAPNYISNADEALIIKIMLEQNIPYQYAKIKMYSSKYMDIDASIATWTTVDFAWWLSNGGSEFLHEEKLMFIECYRDVIKDAAQKYNIPEVLLAGIMYNEFAGDPMFADDVMHGLRSVDWCGPEIIDNNFTVSKNPNLTSFGNTSIQVRRAIEMLGYENPTSEEKDQIISSLKNPVEGIYMSALHLSELRDIDFKDKDISELTEEDIKIIATRYNRGPDISLERVEENLSYGGRIYEN